MSSPLRHISHGIAGFTGAPRPTLVTCAAEGGPVREQDISKAANNAASAARPTMNGLVFDIAAIISAFALGASAGQVGFALHASADKG
jgi:hypothetical protein